MRKTLFIKSTQNYNKKFILKLQKDVVDILGMTQICRLKMSDLESVKYFLLIYISLREFQDYVGGFKLRPTIKWFLRSAFEDFEALLSFY